MGCGARVRGAAGLTPTYVINFADGARVCSSEQTAVVRPTVRGPPAIVRSSHLHREADPFAIDALAVTQQRADGLWRTLLRSPGIEIAPEFVHRTYFLGQWLDKRCK